MESTTVLVVFIIAVALIFDYTNGMHDAANSIATVVSTRVLSPGVAGIWAAFFSFIAFLVFGTGVAKMIGGGLVDLKPINSDQHLLVLLAGLLGVIAWNLITWWLGLPTSSSHALIGGYAGAAVTAAWGFGVIIPAGWYLTLGFIVGAPLLGMALGYFLMTAVFWLFRKLPLARVDKFFRVGQLFSAAAYSLGHGGNDAQKTMGIITAVLVAGHFLEPAIIPCKNIAEIGPCTGLPDIPLWVEISAQGAIALGTLTGGWRIVKTMGSKIVKLQPVGGFCAETAGAITLAFATHFGIPVSTTHTITGAIVGVGSAKRFSAVKWGVAGRIVWAWVLTIPAAAVIAGISYGIIHLIDKLLFAR
ncbi:MAG: inorganic phosphate transporter [Chloracidobacterium sp.]|nr:inorganic phosphate transporter [Chloracidobacterium sp.]